MDFARKHTLVTGCSSGIGRATVTDLVAEGLSNPQIGERMYISRRTVQTRLAHIFAKLDISSRAQLAAEAIRQQD
jgi:DNA-binding NarL/FixJ family response regulator